MIAGACWYVSQPRRQTMDNDHAPAAEKLVRHTPWNKGKIIGAKPLLGDHARTRCHPAGHFRCGSKVGIGPSSQAGVKYLRNQTEALRRRGLRLVPNCRGRVWLHAQRGGSGRYRSDQWTDASGFGLNHLLAMIRGQLAKCAPANVTPPIRVDSCQRAGAGDVEEVKLKASALRRSATRVRRPLCSNLTPRIQRATGWPPWRSGAIAS